MRLRNGGTEVIIERRGDEVVLRAAHEPAETAVRELVRRLREIGPVREIEKRQPIDFPGRPRLY